MGTVSTDVAPAAAEKSDEKKKPKPAGGKGKKAAAAATDKETPTEEDAPKKKPRRRTTRVTTGRTAKAKGKAKGKGKATTAAIDEEDDADGTETDEGDADAEEADKENTPPEPPVKEKVTKTPSKGKVSSAAETKKKEDAKKTTTTASPAVSRSNSTVSASADASAVRASGQPERAAAVKGREAAKVQATDETKGGTAAATDAAKPAAAEKRAPKKKKKNDGTEEPTDPRTVELLKDHKPFFERLAQETAKDNASLSAWAERQAKACNLAPDFMPEKKAGTAFLPNYERIVDCRKFYEQHKKRPAMDRSTGRPKPPAGSKHAAALLTTAKAGKKRKHGDPSDPDGDREDSDFETDCYADIPFSKSGAPIPHANGVAGVKAHGMSTDMDPSLQEKLFGRPGDRATSDILIAFFATQTGNPAFRTFVQGQYALTVEYLYQVIREPINMAMLMMLLFHVDPKSYEVLRQFESEPTSWMKRVAEATSRLPPTSLQKMGDLNKLVQSTVLFEQALLQPAAARSESEIQAVSALSSLSSVPSASDANGQ
jgi:hypothetical protein